MSQKFSNQTLRSLKAGDEIFINPMHDLPASRMRISDVFEDGVGGYVLFTGDDYEEYGELYEDDFDQIFDVKVS